MHWIKTALTRRRVMLAAALLVAALAVPGFASAAPVRVWIDPGHGGHDSGAVGAYGNTEKAVNLTVSAMVVEAAKRQGWDVGSSRDSDTFVPLNARPAAAAAWGATDFISIHANSIDGNPRGSMVIHRGGASAQLGQEIMNQMAPLNPKGNIGNRGDVRGLAVLRGARMPAVIVEVLSMSSMEELVKLTNTSSQRQYAEAIVHGIAAYHGVEYVPPPAPPAPPAAKPTPPADAPRRQVPGPRPVSSRPTRRASIQPQNDNWFAALVNVLTTEEPLTLHRSK